jgi:hypothetical protein
LQEKGFNIEGLAYKNGKLYFGVRGPNLEGNALVIEMAPEPLFNGSMPDGKIYELPVGRGMGVREISTLNSGFLVLTGNAGSEPNKKFKVSEDHSEGAPYTLWSWLPGDAPKKLLQMTRHNGKPEGLLVLKETPGNIDVLIISDGVANGAPMVVSLQKL